MKSTDCSRREASSEIEIQSAFMLYKLKTTIMLQTARECPEVLLRKTAARRTLGQKTGESKTKYIDKIIDKTVNRWQFAFSISSHIK